MVQADTFTLTGDDNPERVRGSRMTASLMPLLGIAPRLGRNFTPDEDLDGTAPVAILSDGLWRRRFGADERVLGQTSSRSTASRARSSASCRAARRCRDRSPADDDLWLPARLSPADRVTEIYHSQKILGRLADGVTPRTGVRARSKAFAARMAAERAVAQHDSARGCVAGRRADRASDQTDAAADRRQRRRCCCSSPAPTRRRCCWRARRTAATSWRCAPRWARRADGCSRWRSPSRWSSPSPRRPRRTVSRRLGAARRAAAVCRLAAGGDPDRHRRARRACSPPRSRPSLGLLFGVVVALHRPDGRLVDRAEGVRPHHLRIERPRARRAGRRAGRARGRCCSRPRG